MGSVDIYLVVFDWFSLWCAVGIGPCYSRWRNPISVLLWIDVYLGVINSFSGLFAHCHHQHPHALYVLFRCRHLITNVVQSEQKMSMATPFELRSGWIHRRPSHRQKRVGSPQGVVYSKYKESQSIERMMKRNWKKQKKEREKYWKVFVRVPPYLCANNSNSSNNNAIDWFWLVDILQCGDGRHAGRSGESTRTLRRDTLPCRPRPFTASRDDFRVHLVHSSHAVSNRSTTHLLSRLIFFFFSFSFALILYRYFIVMVVVGS